MLQTLLTTCLIAQEEKNKTVPVGLVSALLYNNMESGNHMWPEWYRGEGIWKVYMEMPGPSLSRCPRVTLNSRDKN